MKKKLRYFSLIILFYSIEFQRLFAQCNPSMAETCMDANIFCSLDAMNGFSCSNLSTIPSQCSPLCSQGGIGYNTSWWGFVCQGGSVCITMKVGSCANNTGLQFGIWGDCVCGEEVLCRSNPFIAPNTLSTGCIDVEPCKTYFLWVNGGNGDICDFTINTSGGAPPMLSPLGKINNIANQIIEPICQGACNVLFFVNSQSGGCAPTYVWTLDGNEVGGNSNQIRLDFPHAADFVICVTAFLGNPQSGSICSQQGPQCATAKVRLIPNKIGLPRVLCNEQTNSSGYKWHSQRITSSGIYHEQFSDGNCCKYDSIVQFIVLDVPSPASVYFISCDNQPYIDILGNKHFPCRNNSKVLLLKSTNPYKCDSSILLTAVNVDFEPTWSHQCFGGMVELIPNIHLIKSCSAGEAYNFEYRWFKKSDPTHLIGTDERLLVQSVSADYCLEVKVRTELESEIAVCTRTFCETFDEGNLAPECSFKLHDSKVYCFDPTADYWIDEINAPKVNSFSWTVTGGNIISNPDSAAVKIKWQLNHTDTGKICVTYNTDCGTSCQKCIPVFLQTKIAGEDFDKRGLDAYLDAKPGPNGTWRLISGPHHVNIQDPSNPRSRFSAYNYGYYCFEWTINDLNCVMKDTMCVDLHSFPKANPEYPHLLFFERAGKISDQNQLASIIFTPNLIALHGESYVIINSDINSKINYHWYDIYGRALFNDIIIKDSGIQRLNIKSPFHEGMYFLVFEINGISTIRKVCVIE